MSRHFANLPKSKVLKWWAIGLAPQARSKLSVSRNNNQLRTLKVAEYPLDVLLNSIEPIGV